MIITKQILTLSECQTWAINLDTNKFHKLEKVQTHPVTYLCINSKLVDSRCKSAHELSVHVHSSFIQYDWTFAKNDTPQATLKLTLSALARFLMAGCRAPSLTNNSYYRSKHQSTVKSLQGQVSAERIAFDNCITIFQIMHWL